MRAGFSASTTAIHEMGRPRFTTPSWYMSGTSVSSDGAPNGIGRPSVSTKMFFRPGSFAAGTRGEGSLAPVPMEPASGPAPQGGRAGPAPGRGGGGAPAGGGPPPPP